MGPASARATRDAFISHASADGALAARVESALGPDRAWLDRSDIQVGALLGRELLRELRLSACLVLVWSEHASASRWVQAEWIAAVNLDMPVLPLVLDKTALPQCLANAVRLSAQPSLDDALQQLARTVRTGLPQDGSLSPSMRLPDSGLEAELDRLGRAQLALLDSLAEDAGSRAVRRQRELEQEIAALVAAHPLDPGVATLWAYNAKNAVLLDHDAEIRAGIRVEDARLPEAQWRFLHALWLDPLEPSALNGLGTIAWFEHDLDTAEFFVRCALRQAPDYPAAQADLRLVLALQQRRVGDLG